MDEFFALGALRLRGDVRVIAPFPIQIRDLLRRPDLRGRIAMAIEAERHAERLGVLDFVHLVDLAVTLDTTDAAVHMDGVIEIDVVRRLVDLHPRNGPSRGGAFADQRKLGIVLEHLIVAVHARARGGNVREPRSFHRTVAIAAVHAHLLDVDVVGKRDRLDGLVADPRVLGRAIIPDRTHDGRANQHHPDDDHQGQPIGPLRKNR